MILLSHITKPASQRLFTDMSIKTVCDAIQDLTCVKGYDLVVLDEEGNWKVLASAVTYEDADHQLDVYTDQFPHAILDIIPHNDKA